MRNLLILLPFATAMLAGCDQINQKLGLEDQAKKEARQEAEGKAVGSACRHSGRAIEDCYAIYSWLPKSPIYEGWKEMDAYMRDNKITTVEPQLPPPEPPGKKRKKADGEETPVAKTADKSADKGAEKSGDEKSADKGSDKQGEKAGEKAEEKPKEAAAKH